MVSIVSSNLNRYANDPNVVALRSNTAETLDLAGDRFFRCGDPYAVAVAENLVSNSSLNTRIWIAYGWPEGGVVFGQENRFRLWSKFETAASGAKIDCFHLAWGADPAVFSNDATVLKRVLWEPREGGPLIKHA